VRVFLDTNALISAFATRGLCADLFRSVIAEHDLVVGEIVLEEFRRVLRTRFKMPRDRIDQAEELLRSYEVIARPTAKDPVLLRDSDDRWVLANARAGNIDVLVTGDSDFLNIRDQAGLRIVTPREFWSELRAI